MNIISEVLLSILFIITRHINETEYIVDLTPLKLAHIQHGRFRERMKKSKTKTKRYRMVVLNILRLICKLNALELLTICGYVYI